MRSCKRRGVLLLWANLAVCLTLVLGGAALFTVASAARALERSERETDMALLAQEAMETVKYNRRFGAALSLPSEAERNGQRYRVEVTFDTVSVEGLPMERAVCRVEAAEGEPLTVCALLGCREETE